MISVAIPLSDDVVTLSGGRQDLLLVKPSQISIEGDGPNFLKPFQVQSEAAALKLCRTS